MVGFGSFFIAVAALGQRLVVPFWRAERQASAEFSGFLGERLSGLKDIRTAGAGPYAMRRFHEVLRRWFRTEMMASLTSRFSVGANFGVSTAGFAGAIAVGAFLFLRGEITIGTLYLIIHYFELVVGPLWAISDQVEDFQRSTASTQRIRELLETQTTIKDGPGVNIPEGPVSVEFDKVSFAYHAGTDVLQDVSFRLESGRVLGLLGRTGSGKTSMSRLLFRLYDPDRGNVRVGDANVRDVRLADLRRRVGLVTQEVQLFQASVRQNLNLFDNSIDDRRMVDVLEELGLGLWYSSLPDGLDSELTSAGGQLSAGEAQLIAFARVLLKEPDIVILDEAWSRLDPVTERRIEQAVLRLLEGRTAIVIAHRLATLRIVDQVMIIEQGQVQEYGDRETLAADSGSRFSGLIRTGLEEMLA